MKHIISIFALVLLCSCTHAQVTNLDFETWDTGAITLKPFPRGWSSLEDGYCRQSTHAYHGSYALTTSVWYFYAKTAAVQRQAISYNPTSLDGYYTYTDNQLKPIGTDDTVADTAQVAIYLTRWDAVNIRQDTLGKGVTDLYAASAYTHFTCPPVYTDTGTADSITIVLDPSALLRRVHAVTYNTAGADGFGSYFTTDALSLNGSATGVAASPVAAEVTIYPNPSSSPYLDICVFPSGDYHILVTDMAGRNVVSDAFRGSSSRLLVTSLAAGPYLVQISDSDTHDVTTKLFIKQ